MRATWGADSRKSKTHWESTTHARHVARRFRYSSKLQHNHARHVARRLGIAKKKKNETTQESTNGTQLSVTLPWSCKWWHWNNKEHEITLEWKLWNSVFKYNWCCWGFDVVNVEDQQKYDIRINKTCTPRNAQIPVIAKITQNPMCHVARNCLMAKV